MAIEIPIKKETSSKVKVSSIKTTTKAPDISLDKPEKEVNVTSLINQNDISGLLQGEFGMSEWDTKALIKSTGFPIIDALMANSEDEQGLTLRTINTLIGGSGIGKSTFWLQSASKIVSDSKDGQLVIFDAEKTTTVERLKILGAPLDRTTLIKKSTNIENFFKLIKILATKRHEQLEEFGEDYIMENPYIIVADSVSAMSTIKEEEVETDVNKSMGVAARMWSHALKAYNELVFKYNITVLFINQIRDKLSITPGAMKKNLVYEKADETSPGGKAIPFYSFVYTRLGYKGQLKEDQYGFQAIEVEFNLIKSKNSETNRAISAVFIPKSGYSSFWTSLFYLKDNGFVKTGAFYKFDDSKIKLSDMYPKTWRLRDSETKYNEDEDFRKAFDYAVETACREIVSGSVDGKAQLEGDDVEETE